MAKVDDVLSESNTVSPLKKRLIPKCWRKVSQTAFKTQDNILGGIAKCFEKVLNLAFVLMEKFHKSLGSTVLALTVD